MLRHNVITAQGPRKRIEDAAATDGKTRLVVCDGMGGHSAGDVAAMALVEYAMVNTLDKVQDRAPEAVSRACGGSSSGTTCSMAVLTGDRLEVLHAGDSALWLVHYDGSRSTITRLTDDHSTWGVLIQQGSNPNEVSTHYKSRLESCVMGDRAVPIWQRETIMVPTTGKVFLFGTTDGAHEASFCPVRRAIDTDLLLDGFREIVRATPEQAHAILSGWAETTRDNATIAYWRIR